MEVFTAAIAFMKADLAYLRLLKQAASYTDQDQPPVGSEEWERLQDARRLRDDLERELYASWAGTNTSKSKGR